MLGTGSQDSPGAHSAVSAFPAPARIRHSRSPHSEVTSQPRPASKPAGLFVAHVPGQGQQGQQVPCNPAADMGLEGAGTGARRAGQWGQLPPYVAARAARPRPIPARSRGMCPSGGMAAPCRSRAAKDRNLLISLELWVLPAPRPPAAGGRRATQIVYTPSASASLLRPPGQPAFVGCRRIGPSGAGRNNGPADFLEVASGREGALSAWK